MKIQNPEEFVIYKLTNSDSVLGFPFLGYHSTNLTHIEIGDTFFSIGNHSWDVFELLDADYAPTDLKFELDRVNLVEYITKSDYKKEDSFSITGYIDDGGHINAIVYTLGQGDTYKEFDYQVTNGILTKAIQPMLYKEVKITNTKDEDVIFFNEIVRRLTPLKEFVLGLLDRERRATETK